MKNLVILHLESVSKLILQMNEEIFPAVKRLQKQCMNYTNYFSTATSTAMVLNDITYADFFRIENTKIFGNFIETHKQAESFVDELGEAGYETLGVHYPAALGNEINPGHMYARNSDLKNYVSYEKAITDVQTTILNATNAGVPFLIYFCNEVSHLCYADNKKFHIKNPTDRWRYGYEVIDKTVEDIVGFLNQKNLLSSTTIILYGDHGDDFYCHGYNGGYAHSIEPYANIVHTPFMVYDEQIGKGEISDVICSLDIKQLAYNLVGYDNSIKNPYIYDIYKSKREYVFSRNLFAGQTPHKIKGFISNVKKSYAVTTPQYSLILTDDGYRMYINQMDPTCNNNILDFFFLLQGKLRHICELDSLYVHYKSYMGHGTIGEIQRNFFRMHKWMKKELSILQKQTGLKNILKHGSDNKIFYEKNMICMFAKIKGDNIKKKLDKNKEKGTVWERIRGEIRNG